MLKELKGVLFKKKKKNPQILWFLKLNVALLLKTIDILFFNIVAVRYANVKRIRRKMENQITIYNI